MLVRFSVYFFQWVCALKIKLKWIQSPFSRPSVYVFIPTPIPLSLHISFLHPFVRPSVRSLAHNSILSLNSPAEEKPFRGLLLFKKRAFSGRQLCWIQHQLPPPVFVFFNFVDSYDSGNCYKYIRLLFQYPSDAIQRLCVYWTVSIAN